MNLGAQSAVGQNLGAQSVAGQGPLSQSHAGESPAGQSPVVQGTVLKDTVSQDAVLPNTVTDAPATGAIADGRGMVVASAVTDRAGSQHGYPDTITMTTPGSMAGHGATPLAPPAASAPPAPAVPASGAPQPWQAVSESAWAGPVPQGSGSAGTAGGQAFGQPVPGSSLGGMPPLPGVPPVTAPPSAAPPSAGPQSAAPPSAGPQSAGPRAAGPVIAPGGPVGPPPGMQLPQMPARTPARAGPPGTSSPPGSANPPGALIDVPPWLAAPGAPTQARRNARLGAAAAPAARVSAAEVSAAAVSGAARRRRTRRVGRHAATRRPCRARHPAAGPHRPGAARADLPRRAT